MNYEEAVNYIFNIPRFSDRGKTGNENLIQVLDMLHMPHKAHRCIHIAGTNGKGSTAQFIKNILVSAGMNAGIFTSPHLVRVNERIVTVEAGREKLIDDDAFLAAFHEVKEKNDILVAEGNPHISFFEFIFAMAAVYFAKRDLDFVIYETGLGGRLDATNVLMPDVSIITSIGLDHTKYLGDTIEKIAYEKAGIIKKNVPVVYNTGDEQADKIICGIADTLGADAINVAKTKYIINEITDKTIDFSVSGSYYSYDNLKINMCAVYQIDNAVTAIEACYTLFKNTDLEKKVMDQTVIKKSLQDFFWAGRMERIHERVILDGAHNLDAIKRFVETVRLTNQDKPIILLYGSSDDKDYENIINYICNNLNLKKVYITQSSNERGLQTEIIGKIFDRNLKDKGVCISSDRDIKTSFQEALYEAVHEDTMLYCVGSLYLVGGIKEFNNRRNIQ
ncbi:MAG: Mur ligase family protein [Clostridium sp.]|nr:Mur ligase family protein [Clostridium sp.]MCM1171347.1 Mur ligase family protein [Clostridium sp.]MCM1209426.1 Mur ligase family protein [Ruminococcus sp.]